MSFVTFEEIMGTIAREHAGVIVRNCAPKSVEEAKEAAKKHPELTLKIYKTKEYGTCIAICPRDYHPDEAVKAAGLAGLFKRRKK